MANKVNKKPPMLGGKRFITADSAESTTLEKTSDSQDSPSKIPRRQGNGSAISASTSSPAKTASTASSAPRPAARNLANQLSSSSEKPTTDDSKVRTREKNTAVDEKPKSSKKVRERVDSENHGEVDTPPPPTKRPVVKKTVVNAGKKKPKVDASDEDYTVVKTDRVQKSNTPVKSNVNKKLDLDTSDTGKSQTSNVQTTPDVTENKSPIAVKKKPVSMRQVRTKVFAYTQVQSRQKLKKKVSKLMKSYYSTHFVY